MSNRAITIDEIEALIAQIGPHLGCGDFTYKPVFPKGRTDVCVVRRTAEDGHSYGYDTLFLIWRGVLRSVQHCEVFNSRNTKDYIFVREVIAEKNVVTVQYGSGGSYGGKVWEDSAVFTIALG